MPNGTRIVACRNSIASGVTTYPAIRFGIPGGAEGVGRAVNQAVVIAFLGIFAFNYVFTQTLLATHPEINVIK